MADQNQTVSRRAFLKNSAAILASSTAVAPEEAPSPAQVYGAGTYGSLTYGTATVPNTVTLSQQSTETFSGRMAPLLAAAALIGGSLLVHWRTRLSK